MRWCLILFMLVVLRPLLICDVGAAERTKPIRIGVLTDSWGPTPGVVGLRDGLKELGYRENQDFVIGVRFTQGNIAALPQAARELVERGIDILVTNNPAPAKAAQMATNRIPIVFHGAGDPIELGLVKSFARPGGNINREALDRSRLRKRRTLCEKKIRVADNSSQLIGFADRDGR